MPELVGIRYDFKAISLATGTTNHDVRSNVAELFDNIDVAKRVAIETDQTISVRFNNSNYPAITIDVAANQSPFQLPKDFLDVVNIFITNNSGSTANISILLA